MLGTPHFGTKQAKILGITRAYGIIELDVVAAIYSGNRPAAIHAIKQLEKKGLMLRVGAGLFCIKPNARIDWLAVKKEGTVIAPEDSSETEPPQNL